MPLAEDEKLKAEAHAIMGCCGRASRAKEIDGELGADQSLDPDWEDPAIRMLRESRNGSSPKGRRSSLLKAPSEGAKIVSPAAPLTKLDGGEPGHMA